MALLTSVPIRFTIYGDGVSTELTINLKKTYVQFLDGRYGTIYQVPDSVLSMSVGGPGISPERTGFVEKADIDGTILSMRFAAPLLLHKDHYTVECILGFKGLEPVAPSPEPSTQFPLPEASQAISLEEQMRTERTDSPETLLQ